MSVLYEEGARPDVDIDNDMILLDCGVLTLDEVLNRLQISNPSAYEIIYNIFDFYTNLSQDGQNYFGTRTEVIGVCIACSSTGIVLHGINKLEFCWNKFVEKLCYLLYIHWNKIAPALWMIINSSSNILYAIYIYI